MNTSKIRKWAELLLDTGKKNNLINCKDSGTSMAEIVLSAADVVYGKVMSQNAMEIVFPKDGEGEEFSFLPLTRDEYVLKYGGLVKKACPPVRHRPLVSPRKARARAQGDDLCIRALGEGERRSRGSRACED